jgi:rhodanese-related sulfurtransferase
MQVSDSSDAPRGQSRRRFGLLGGVLTLAWLAGCSNTDEAEGKSVGLDLARAELAAGHVRLFDIREPQEQARGVAPGATLLPMSQLGTRLGEIPRDAAQPVLLICQTQNRSSKVAAALREQGYTNVRYVHGGMGGWSDKGWPLVAPPR